MLVKNWMTSKVITTKPSTSMHDAVQLMQRHHIRTLPVMRKEKLVGMVTDRDIKQASSSRAEALEPHELQRLNSKIKLKEIMRTDYVTAPSDYTIEETALLMALNKVSGIPVLDHDDHLEGVITQTDVFKALVSLTGADRQGIQFAFLIEDQPGSIKPLTDIIRDYGGRLISILTSYDRAPDGYRKLYVRAFAINRLQLPALKKKLSDCAPFLYMIDHREDQREFGQN